jgi:hypothetical protein
MPEIINTCCEPTITPLGQNPLVPTDNFKNTVCLYNLASQEYEQYFRYVTTNTNGSSSEVYLFENLGTKLSSLPVGRVVPCVQDVHVVNDSGSLIETLDCNNEPALKVFDPCLKTSVDTVNTSVNITGTSIKTGVDTVNTSVNITGTAIKASVDVVATTLQNILDPTLQQIRDNISNPSGKIIEGRVNVPATSPTLVLNASNRRTALLTWVSSSDKREPLYIGFLGTATPEVALTARFGQPIQIEGYMTKNEVYVWTRAEVVLSTIEFLD